MTRTEATRAAQQAANKYWGIALSLASAAVYYAWSAWRGTMPDEARVTAVMTGALGIGQWVVQQISDRNKVDTQSATDAAAQKITAQNKADTEAAVNKKFDYETLLAALGIGERFAAMERSQKESHAVLQDAQNEHHAENSAKLEAIIHSTAENDRLHAEHVSVTDSLADGLTRVGEVVAELKPGFLLPPIHERQKPATRGDA